MSAAPLWTSDAMASAMCAQTRGALPQAITGISIDSRTIGPGEAYFAIRGAVHDGHAFVDAALKAGAGLAVVEKAMHGCWSSTTCWKHWSISDAPRARASMDR
jgi:UDP-N-acetylmuramoyl-tripeptide--D-alanyl-D-alanine ligase